jgi:predicted ATPase
MPYSSQRDFRTTELITDLLLTPFEVQTKWHVITGAPSSGKTTLIHLLAEKGFQTIPECARQYMEEEIARGRTIEEIHENAVALQRRVVALQLSVEGGLKADDVVFIDGGVPSSLAWYRLFGLNPNEILRQCFHRRYASVFILDRLPLELDGLRFEGGAHTSFLDEWLTRDYRALGYEVVRVPVLAPEERLAFVLEAVAAQRLT